MKNKCRHKKDNRCNLNKEFCQDFYEQQKLCVNYEESDCSDHQALSEEEQGIKVEGGEL